MIVLLDVDGPLTDGFTARYLEHLGAITGKRHELDEVEDYDLSHVVRRHVTPTNHAAAVNFIVGQLALPGVATTFDACGLAKAAVASFHMMGAEVWAVTSPFVPSPTWAHDRSRWLEDNFAISPKRVIHAIEKHRVAGDLFLDDKPEHVTAWRKVHGQRARVGAWLWGKKYNEASPIRPRTDSWAEVLEAVRAGMKAA